MSFKIFTLQLSGKLKTVEVVENQRKTLSDDYNEFLRVGSSEELKNYLELKEWIDSADFMKRKAEIDSLQYKGSTEFNQLKEFEGLQKAKHIKKFFIASGSSELKRFGSIKESGKLQRYYFLLEFIKEGEFEKEEKEIESQVFKGSVEQKHWVDFVKLEKSAGIKAYLGLHQSEDLKKHEKFAESEKLKKFLEFKNAPERDRQKRKEYFSLKIDAEIRSYFKLEKSKKLKLYRETTDSYDLKRYNDLKSYVYGDEYKKREVFLKDKKKFEKSDTFKKQQEFKKLAADTEIKFFLKYEKSAIYKNYLDVKDSFDLKRFYELKVITASKEFLERKAYLEDRKKWEKTEDYAKQQKFLEMKKFPHLIKFFKYKDTTAFEFFKKWKVTFEDDFSDTKLNREKWSVLSNWADKTLGENFSLPGDLHIFTMGNNLRVNGKLAIEVKKEKSKGKVWQMSAGFMPVEFDYTSGLISTAKSFWQEDGIFEAKIRFKPAKQLVSSVSLCGEKNIPLVNLVEIGTKNRIGISTLDKNGKVQNEGIDISNLKKGKSYIFSMEKSGKSFTWRINDVEVFKLENQEINFPLHINASTILVNEIPASSLPLPFEIGYVKCYSKV